MARYAAHPAENAPRNHRTALSRKGYLSVFLLAGACSAGYRSSGAVQLRKRCRASAPPKRARARCSRSSSATRSCSPSAAARRSASSKNPSIRFARPHASMSPNSCSRLSLMFWTRRRSASSRCQRSCCASHSRRQKPFESQRLRRLLRQSLCFQPVIWWARWYRTTNPLLVSSNDGIRPQQNQIFINGFPPPILACGGWFWLVCGCSRARFLARFSGDM